jgi:hypothetical protein
VVVLHSQDIQLRPVDIPNDVSYWQRSGFVEMVPPIQLPTDRRNDNLIRVWLKIPDRALITLERLADQQRYTLKFPPGTIADRVETMKGEQKAMLMINGIEDVRGATIDPTGATRFHVYQPIPGGAPDRWRGDEWLRSDNAADDLAADSLIRLFFPNAGDAAQAEMRNFRRLNQCGACHQVNRPMPTMVKPVVPSPSVHLTDSHGFFQPITVLDDTMPVRSHRRWDRNADDPFVTVWCGTQQARAVTDGDRRGYTCPDGAQPIGKLDMAAALARKDLHAEQVCASRKYLFDHMEQTGRDAYRPFFTECGIR